MPDSPARLPLDGVTVLDFTQVEFGPIATQTLADFGAKVIKIERPGVGDIIRHIDQHATDIDTSAYYLSLNRNKSSVCVNLKSEQGIAVLRELLSEADVLVENFRPGVLEKAGLGFDEVHEQFPHLIYASGTGFGPTGPLSGKGGQDMLAQSLSGAANHARDAAGRPQLHPVSFADFGAGQALVQGILLAIIERQRSGLGQHVEVNLFDTMLFAQLQELTQWKLRGKETNFVKDNLAGVFKTEDGWITIVGLFRENPLRDICAAFDMEDLSKEERFKDLKSQLANKGELWPLLDAALGGFSTEECLKRLDAADILCAPVLTHDAVLSHEQAIANGAFMTTEHPVAGEVTVVKSPVRLSRNSGTPVVSPPKLGADTNKVLADVLGYSPAKLDELRDAGAIA